uniref:Protein kinase domain-containing protein n=1 Tax=Astyanax mexicanus TaxID=7994 RepID=A0A3B1IIP0_ASTMX
MQRKQVYIYKVQKSIFGGISLVFNHSYHASWHVLLHQFYTLLLDNFMPPTPGAKIQAVQLSENFDVIMRLGSGSFGSVLKVKHKVDSKVYAMKIGTFLVLLKFIMNIADRLNA